MIGIGIADSLGVNLSGLNPATKSFITSAGISDASTVTTINNLVNGLQASGLWSKMKAVYPFVTDNRNLLSYTEDFSNAVWQRQNTSITANVTIAPNGTLTADKITENAATGYHTCTFATSIITTTNVYALSFYAKAAERSWCSVYLYDGVLYEAFFDLANGVVGSVASGATSLITNVGNGWYRCTIIRTVTSSGVTNGGIMTANGNNQSSFAGTTGSGIYIWGAQLDAAATPTTYQPIATTPQAYIANQFKYNLVNPVDSDAAFRLVFNGGWTHSSNGATPNGTNGYADTFLNASTQITSNNNHVSIYLNQSGGRYERQIGFLQTSPLCRTYLYASYGDGNSYSLIQTSSESLNFANTNRIGLFTLSRTASNSQSVYLNADLKENDNQVSTTLPSLNYFIGASNDNGTGNLYSNALTQFSTIGSGLNATDVSNLSSIITTFNTSLSR